MSSVLDLMRSSDSNPDRFNARSSASSDPVPDRRTRRFSVWWTVSIVVTAMVLTGLYSYRHRSALVRLSGLGRTSVRAVWQPVVTPAYEHCAAAPPVPGQPARQAEVARVKATRSGSFPSPTLVPPVPKNRVSFDQVEALPEWPEMQLTAAASLEEHSDAGQGVHRQAPAVMFDAAARPVPTPLLETVSALMAPSSRPLPVPTIADKPKLEVDLEALLADLLVRALEADQAPPVRTARSNPPANVNNQAVIEEPVVEPDPVKPVARASSAWTGLTRTIGLQGTMLSAGEPLAILASGRLVSVGDEVAGYRVEEIGNGWIRCQGLARKIPAVSTAAQANPSSQQEF